MVGHVGIVMHHYARASDAFQEMRCRKAEINLFGASYERRHFQLVRVMVGMNVHEMAGVCKMSDFGPTLRHGFICVDAQKYVVTTILTGENIVDEVFYHFGSWVGIAPSCNKHYALLCVGRCNAKRTGCDPVCCDGSEQFAVSTSDSLAGKPAVFVGVAGDSTRCQSVGGD